MNYELARELKDAGFTQYDDEQRQIDNFGILLREGFSNEDTRKKAVVCYIPSLSELIDVCGDEFSSLLKCADEEWRAYGGAKKGEVLYHKGSTSEEAVARLWLALNPKN